MMAQGLPITVSSLTPGYILLSALAILLYDVVTHLDEEIDYVTKSGSPSVKVIFILCRYLPFIIGILRVPIDVVGAGVNDDKVCLALLRSSIWLCVAQMACAEFIFLLRTYALWGCSKRVLFVLLTVYTAACVTDITSIQRYNASLTAEACYGVAHPNASALLAGFVSLVALEIGLFGITMYRVLMQYRATSGKLLNLLMRHNIMYFAAGVVIFLLRTYALWGCSKRILFVLLTVYTAACVTDIASIQRYNASLTAEACYGVALPNASALLVGFASLLTLEIGLFGITMCRVLMQYRATSGKLLNLLMRHNIMYFAAGVALNLLNIVGILLDPAQTKWHTDVIEIVQILFQALLATRMQLHLWSVNRHTVQSTALTMSMEDFQVRRSDSTVHQDPRAATPDC
ncbi:hypothetical protein AZE42_03883 [Rhizopogon vesiculosus]|uniref:DUF6533 domain-containing protein n=1 Tax=Rhizopogon vesiculosus TaxID=180088 RepID=A0A1J8QN79_9AGAM|nr:hypothetical protein AZE42_03883 [Rhizopogon vesiculosus]